MIKRMPSHKYSAHLARWGNQLRHRMGGPTRSYDLTYDGKYYKLSPLCLVLEEHTHR